MNRLLKYRDITKITMSNSLVYFWDFISGNMFLILIMFVYLKLWTNIYSGNGDTMAGLSLNQMIWYLVVTELITLSRSNLYIQISEDVKTGAIAYLLNKPYEYVLYCFSSFLGELAVKLLSNSIIGIAVGLVFVGALEGFSLMHLPFILLSILVGCCIHFLIYMILALTAFWLEENAPFFWIYNKLVFTLGGMLIPIDMFPGWLRSISAFLPFSYVTYVPAKLTVAFSLESFIRGFSIQLIYLAAFFLLALLVYRRGAKKLNVNGG